jgi:hypothetical protein
MKLLLGLRGTAECNDVCVEVFVNQKLIAQRTSQLDEFITELVLPENPAAHVVEICISGKTEKHTEVDAQGNIVSDVAFIIETLQIEDIDMKPVFCQGRQCYYHSSNIPNGPIIQDELYDYIGFNGKVQLEFFTPIYLWMSEYF